MQGQGSHPIPWSRGAISHIDLSGCLRILATLRELFAAGLEVGFSSFFGVRRGRADAREIGIRIASAPTGVVSCPKCCGAAPLIAGLGCAAGLAAAIAATRAIQSLLFGIPSSDPVTFATALAAIHVIVLLASYAPGAAGGRRRSGGDFKDGEGGACRNYSWMTVTVASLLFET